MGNSGADTAVEHIISPFGYKKAAVASEHHFFISMT